ncbi:unnamed protein product [Cladocopium goreaui]|uniref:Inversin n=1 Tax=Cladocopium goreaui TaxID=2562237 RepID=A0A9P1DMP3_9DINO|nr:unnamed protein product [Cladocopium goreaui]
MVQQETMENLGEGFPGFDLYEKRLEEENGVRVDLVTQSFLEASELGDADSLRRKLNGLNVDQRRELVHAVDQQGASGLLLAVKGGKKEVAKVLLDFGANPNDADSSGATAGHYASMRGDPGLLKLLLDARCDAGRVDDRQDGLLAWAKGPEVVQLLLDAQADPAQRGVGGQTALMYACERGDFSAARALAMGGERQLLSVLSDAGESAWSLAKSNGHQEIVEMLSELGVEAPASQSRLMHREEVLWDAAKMGDAQAIRQVTARCDDTPLDVNVQEPGGDTPLLLACGVGFGAAAAVEVLLQARADPNLPDPYMGETPLGGSSLKVLMLLLEARADPTLKDLTQRSAADIAESWSYSDAKEVLMAAQEGML